jgi:SOS-response transcriptional repressor LexA
MLIEQARIALRGRLTMTTLAERLKRARLAAGHESATEAAEKFGWNPNTYRSVENGTRKPGSLNAIEYADAFEVRLDWLLTGRGAMREGQQRQAPIYHLRDIKSRTNHSRRALELATNARGFLPVPEAWNVSRHTFAVEIADDSMIERPASAQSLYPGDMVVVDPEAELEPGCIVVALATVRDEPAAIVRRLVVTPKPNRFFLSAFNDAYPDISIDRKALLGVMVGMYRRPARRT